LADLNWGRGRPKPRLMQAEMRAQSTTRQS
jgi:hypothetical protein